MRRHTALHQIEAARGEEEEGDAKKATKSQKLFAAVVLLVFVVLIASVVMSATAVSAAGDAAEDLSAMQTQVEQVEAVVRRPVQTTLPPTASNAGMSSESTIKNTNCGAVPKGTLTMYQCQCSEDNKCAAPFQCNVEGTTCKAPSDADCKPASQMALNFTCSECSTMSTCQRLEKTHQCSPDNKVCVAKCSAMGNGRQGQKYPCKCNKATDPCHSDYKCNSAAAVCSQRCDVANPREVPTKGTYDCRCHPTSNPCHEDYTCSPDHVCTVRCNAKAVWPATSSYSCPTHGPRNGCLATHQYDDETDTCAFNGCGDPDTYACDCTQPGQECPESQFCILGRSGGRCSSSCDVAPTSQYATTYECGCTARFGSEDDEVVDGVRKTNRCAEGYRCEINGDARVCKLQDGPSSTVFGVGHSSVCMADADTGFTHYAWWDYVPKDLNCGDSSRNCGAAPVADPVADPEQGTFACHCSDPSNLLDPAMGCSPFLQHTQIGRNLLFDQPPTNKAQTNGKRGIMYEELWYQNPEAKKCVQENFHWRLLPFDPKTPLASRRGDQVCHDSNCPGAAAEMEECFQLRTRTAGAIAPMPFRRYVDRYVGRRELLAETAGYNKLREQSYAEQLQSGDPRPSDTPPYDETARAFLSSPVTLYEGVARYIKPQHLVKCAALPGVRAGARGGAEPYRTLFGQYMRRMTNKVQWVHCESDEECDIPALMVATGNWKDGGGMRVADDGPPATGNLFCEGWDVPQKEKAALFGACVVPPDSSLWPLLEEALASARASLPTTAVQKDATTQWERYDVFQDESGYVGLMLRLYAVVLDVLRVVQDWFVSNWFDADPYLRQFECKPTLHPTQVLRWITGCSDTNGAPYKVDADKWTDWFTKEKKGLFSDANNDEYPDWDTAVTANALPATSQLNKVWDLYETADEATRSVTALDVMLAKMNQGLPYDFHVTRENWARQICLWNGDAAQPVGVPNSLNSVLRTEKSGDYGSLCLDCRVPGRDGAACRGSTCAGSTPMEENRGTCGSQPDPNRCQCQKPWDAPVFEDDHGKFKLHWASWASNLVSDTNGLNDGRCGKPIKCYNNPRIDPSTNESKAEDRFSMFYPNEANFALNRPMQAGCQCQGDGAWYSSTTSELNYCESSTFHNQPYLAHLGGKNAAGKSLCGTSEYSIVPTAKHGPHLPFALDVQCDCSSGTMTKHGCFDETCYGWAEEDRLRPGLPTPAQGEWGTAIDPEGTNGCDCVTNQVGMDQRKLGQVTLNATVRRSWDGLFCTNMHQCYDWYGNGAQLQSNKMDQFGTPIGFTCDCGVSPTQDSVAYGPQCEFFKKCHNGGTLLKDPLTPIEAATCACKVWSAETFNTLPGDQNLCLNAQVRLNKELKGALLSPTVWNGTSTVTASALTGRDAWKEEAGLTAAFQDLKDHCSRRELVEATFVAYELVLLSRKDAVDDTMQAHKTELRRQLFPGYFNGESCNEGYTHCVFGSPKMGAECPGGTTTSKCCRCNPHYTGRHCDIPCGFRCGFDSEAHPGEWVAGVNQETHTCFDNGLRFYNPNSTSGGDDAINEVFGVTMLGLRDQLAEVPPCGGTKTVRGEPVENDPWLNLFEPSCMKETNEVTEYYQGRDKIFGDFVVRAVKDYTNASQTSGAVKEGLAHLRTLAWASQPSPPIPQTIQQKPRTNWSEAEQAVVQAAMEGHLNEKDPLHHPLFDHTRRVLFYALNQGNTGAESLLRANTTEDYARLPPWFQSNATVRKDKCSYPVKFKASLDDTFFQVVLDRVAVLDGDSSGDVDLFDAQVRFTYRSADQNILGIVLNAPVGQEFIGIRARQGQDNEFGCTHENQQKLNAKTKKVAASAVGATSDDEFAADGLTATDAVFLAYASHPIGWAYGIYRLVKGTNYKHKRGDTHRVNYYFGTDYEGTGLDGLHQSTTHANRTLHEKTKKMSLRDDWFLTKWGKLYASGRTTPQANRMGCLVPGHTYTRAVDRGQYSERYFSSHDLGKIDVSSFLIREYDTFTNDLYEMKIDGVTLAECLPGEPWAFDPDNGEEFCWITGSYKDKTGGTKGGPDAGHEGNLHVKLIKVPYYI